MPDPWHAWSSDPDTEQPWPRIYILRTEWRCQKLDQRLHWILPGYGHYISYLDLGPHKVCAVKIKPPDTHSEAVRHQWGTSEDFYKLHSAAASKLRKRVNCLVDAEVRKGNIQPMRGCLDTSWPMRSEEIARCGASSCVMLGWSLEMMIDEITWDNKYVHNCVVTPDKWSQTPAPLSQSEASVSDSWPIRGWGSRLLLSRSINGDQTGDTLLLVTQYHHFTLQSLNLLLNFLWCPQYQESLIFKGRGLFFW